MNSQELLPSKHYEVSKGTGFMNSGPRGDKRKLLLVISGTSWWDTLIISAFRRLRNNITSKVLPQNKQQFPGVNYYHHPFYRKEKQGTGRSGNCSTLHTSLAVVYS